MTCRARLTGRFFASTSSAGRIARDDWQTVPDDIAAPAATDGRAPQKFIICTDGSCIGNPGQGGWAYVVTTPDGEPVAQQSGHCRQTTNSRMELTAVAEALEYTAEQKRAVTIRSDSKYVVDGLQQRMDTELAAQRLAHRLQTAR